MGAPTHSSVQTLSRDCIQQMHVKSRLSHILPCCPQMLHIHPQGAACSIGSHSLEQRQRCDPNLCAAALPYCPILWEHVFTLTAFQGVLGQRSAVFGCDRGAQADPHYGAGAPKEQTQLLSLVPAYPEVGSVQAAAILVTKKCFFRPKVSSEVLWKHKGGAEERIRTQDLAEWFL